MRNDFEHKEQVKLFQWIDRWKDEYEQLDTIFAIPNGGYRSISTAKKLKAEGVRAGVPDIFVSGVNIKDDNEVLMEDDYVCMYNLGLFIEMKYGKNKLQDNQIEWFARLQRRGYKCLVCYSAKEAARSIADYLGLPQRLVDSYLGFPE